MTMLWNIMRAFSRPLTPGERALAASVFGDAIDYDAVHLVRRAWWPLQPRNIVMAPCGNIHFHGKSELWSEDFSTEPLHAQGLFIHEMTHVWQAQLRGKYYLPLMRHPFCKYRYRFRPGRPFERYGLEQQAEIVRHAFVQRNGRSVSGAPALEMLAGILPFGSEVSLAAAGAAEGIEAGPPLAPASEAHKAG